MPELPEVEVIASNLNLKLKNHTVTGCEIKDKKRLPSPPLDLLNYTVSSAYRLGKTVIIEFQKGKSKTIYLEVHLRMTGRLLLEKFKVPSNSKELALFVNKILAKNEKNISKHVRAQFNFKDGVLLFVDPRKFGTFKWHLSKPSLPQNAIDALDPELNITKFLEILEKHKKQNIKNFLMDQKRIVGIGNIYASEILFLSQVSPDKTIEKISPSKRTLLYKNTKKVLRAAIKNNGTTFSDYQREDGSKGGYQFKLKVYGREGLPCKICKMPIQRLVQGQRSTFYCSKCQK